MIIGFSRYGSGGSGPVLDYLTGYLVNGEARDPKPQVVRGDPRVVAEIIDALHFQRRYSSGVLSFAAEDQVTSKIQEDIMNRFESAVFAGLPPDRRSIVWIKHGDKGRTELHFVVPRVDLGTRKSLNIAPPTPASRQLLDTLREGINRRYGFRDPSDPDCAKAVSVPAHVAKLAAQAKRLGRSARPDIRQAITERLESQARAGMVSSRADVVRSLKEQGFAVTRAGVNYVTIARPDTGERVRLKGNIYREHFSPQDLQPTPVRHNPAQLLMLDRRLEQLVEKRATYHRARYEVNKDTDQPVLQLKEGLADDRTQNPFTQSRSAFGNISPRAPTAVCREALRLDEATQHFRHATHNLERSGQRLDEADRTFARDIEQAEIDVNRPDNADALVAAYGLQQRDRRQELDMELELEP